MHDGEMSLIVERLERRERGMQAEKAVEIDDLVLRNRDRGPHRVVVLLVIGHNNVEAVGGAALEDNHKTAAGSCRLGHDGADEEAGNRRRARDGERAFVEEESPVDLHVSPHVRAQFRFPSSGAGTPESR